MTALMMWALAAMVTIAGFYLIRKIDDTERRLQKVETMLTRKAEGKVDERDRVD